MSAMSLILLAVILISVSLMIWGEANTLEEKLREETKGNYVRNYEIMITNRARNFSYDVFNPLYRMDIDRINHLIKNLKSEMPIKSVLIADATGKVLTDGTRENLSFGTILNADIQRLKSRQSSSTRSANGHIVTFTIGSQDHIAGYGEVLFSDDPLKNTFQQQEEIVFSVWKETQRRFRDIALIGILFVLSFTVFLGFLFSRTLAAPILKLRDATRKVAKGDLSYRLEVNSGDELGDLADSFNRMADELLKTTVSKQSVDDIIRNMNDALIVVSTEGKIKMANQAALILLGYTEDQLTHQPFDIIFKGEKRPFERLRLNDLWSEGSPVLRNIETTFFSKDGRRIPVLLSGSAMTDGEGKIQGLVYVALDITERKAAEEELGRYREHLEELVRNRTTELTEANKQLQEEIAERKWTEESLIKSEEETRSLVQENATVAEIGRIISSTLNIQEVYERFAEEVQKLLPFDRIAINIVNPKEYTMKVAYTTGVEIPERLHGDTVPLIGTFTEEVVRTRRSQVLQEEEKEILRRFPGLLFSLKVGLRSTMAVPLISQDAVIGVLNFRSVRPNAYDERHLRLAERVGNQIGGAIANSQLFTQRTRAEEEKTALEEQLRQSQKIEAIGRLAGGIAHDFDNLLTIIKSNSELSLAKVKKNGPLKKNIQEIRRASQRASYLTHQLLAFSHRQILEFKALDLNIILRDMARILRRILGEEIDLDIRFAEGLGKIKTNRGQIEQAIFGLALNARDAMPSGGNVTIETANVYLDETYARTRIGVTPGHYVMLSISDTGTGMTPEVKKHLFEPFFTTKEKGKGTGLGLSTIYGIVKQSEGDIWVSSELGGGTTFKIYLPRVEEPAMPSG